MLLWLVFDQSMHMYDVDRCPDQSPNTKHYITEGFTRTGEYLLWNRSLKSSNGFLRMTSCSDTGIGIETIIIKVFAASVCSMPTEFSVDYFDDAEKLKMSQTFSADL